MTAKRTNQHWLKMIAKHHHLFPPKMCVTRMHSRGVLVLLVSVQILVRLDCFSHSIKMEVWKPARWKRARFHRNEHSPVRCVSSAAVAVSRGVLWSRGVSGPGGCLLPGVVSAPGGSTPGGVCSGGCLFPWGVYSGGVSAPRGYLLGGCLLCGVSALGGVCSGGCLLPGGLLLGGVYSWGVCSQGCLLLGGCLLPGVCLMWGVSAPGGVVVSHHTLSQTPPPPLRCGR